MSKGFVKFDNDLIEYWMQNKAFSAADRVAMVILRKTVGFNKSSEKISISDFKKLTGISTNCVVSDALKKLEEKGLIRVERRGTKGSYYSIVNPSTCMENHTSTSMENNTSSSMENHTSTSMENNTNPFLIYKDNKKDNSKDSRKTATTAYGIYKNVFLSDEQYRSLKAEYSIYADKYINKVSKYIKNGRSYSDPYATIVDWILSDHAQDLQAQKQKESERSFSLKELEEFTIFNDPDFNY